jgi:hypothetical protein
VKSDQVSEVAVNIPTVPAGVHPPDVPQARIESPLRRRDYLAYAILLAIWLIILLGVDTR